MKKLNIIPLKISYVISKDITYFYYEEHKGKKVFDRMIVIKGKYKGKITVYEVTNFILKLLEEGVNNG